MQLALDTEFSTRNLSFVETGRSRPTPTMIDRLAASLEVPLRERNELFLAAGYAPQYLERDLRSPEPHAIASVGGQELSFFSIAASVVSAVDVTVDDLHIEAFHPADAATAAAVLKRA